jgi:hypothetical protein
MIQDLDNPAKTWNRIQRADDGNGLVLSFEKVTARRFSLTAQTGDIPTVFDEITIPENPDAN